MLGPHGDVFNRYKQYKFQRTIPSFDISGVKELEHSRTWITFPDGQPSWSIEELQLLNGAHLALEPNPSANVEHEAEFLTIVNEDFILDDTKLGILHVGPHQKITVRYSKIF